MTPDEVIAKVRDLPPVSQSALKLAGVLNRHNVSNDEIADVLKYDNVLTARLLRACNSPMFGFEEPVYSVDQAVLMLGHQQILHVVLSLTFGGVLSAALPGYAIEARELLLHSLTTAVAAEVVANADTEMHVDPPVAFTAGLLHDFGKLAFNEVLTPEVQSAIRTLVSNDGISRSMAEERIIGTNHSQVGAHLLEQWRLPAVIVEATANHHHPLFEPSPKLSVVINLADQLAHHAGAGIGWESFGERVYAQVYRVLGLEPESFESMLMSVHDSSSLINRIMSVPCN